MSDQENREKFNKCIEILIGHLTLNDLKQLEKGGGEIQLMINSEMPKDILFNKFSVMKRFPIKINEP